MHDEPIDEIATNRFVWHRSISAAKNVAKLVIIMFCCQSSPRHCRGDFFLVRQQNTHRWYKFIMYL